MGHASYGALFHVALNAIVLDPDASGVFRAEGAAFHGVAAEACAAIGSFLFARPGLVMNGMAGAAGQLAVCGLVALAHFKRRILPLNGLLQAARHRRGGVEGVGFGPPPRAWW